MAWIAAGVERDRHRHDHVADREVVDARTDLDDLAAELVAHHEVAGRARTAWARAGSAGSSSPASSSRQAASLLTVLDEVQVAAADAAGQHLRQDLALARCRLVDVVDPQFPVRHHSSAHGADSRRPSRAGVGSAGEVGDGVDDEVERGVGVDLDEHRAVRRRTLHEAPLVDHGHAAGVRRRRSRSRRGARPARTGRDGSAPARRAGRAPGRRRSRPGRCG